MAMKKYLILRKPPPGPRPARPEDRLRGCLEGRTALIQLLVVSASGKHNERFADGCI